MERQASPRPAHQPSMALTDEENRTVFRLLGFRCQAQATGVVQVYGTEQPYHNCWHKMLCGVATFTKDNTRRSFYVQVFDMAEGAKVFEQEVYREFEYHKSMDFFHQFEGDDRMIGLNFADDVDAANFAKVVTSLLANRKRRREERKRQVMQEQQQRLSAGQQQNYKTLPITNKEKKKFMTLGRKEKKKYRKAMIGLPTDFQHVSHVGVGKDSLASFNVDAELKDLLTAVGLDQKELSDNGTREFVFDYIERHGGMEEFRKESRKYSKKSHDGDASRGASSFGGQHQQGTNRVPPPPPPPISSTSPSVHSTAPPAVPKSPRPTYGNVRSGGVPPPPPPRHNQGGADDAAPPPSPPKFHISAPAPPPSRIVCPPPQQPLFKGGVIPSPSVNAAKGGMPPPASKGVAPPPQPARGREGFSYPTPTPVSTVNFDSLSSSISSYAVPPPPSMSKGAPQYPTPPPPSAVVAPPPPLPTAGVPPPPPLPTGGVPPPPPVPSGGALRPSPAGGLGASSNPRSAVLEQIRSGVRPLKKVTASPAVKEALPGDSRSQLLQDIRTGIKLNKVAEAEAEAEPRLEGLALGLHHALQERAKYIQSNDDSNDSLDDEEDDDDEWDEE